MATGYQNEFQRQQLAHRPKITVRVIEARGIKAADWSGTSDPYVEIRIKGQSNSQKTKVIKKTLSPYWNEEFVVYPATDYDYISLKVYDYDSTTNNDLLGEVEISCSLVLSMPPAEKWYQLQRKKGSTFHNVAGELKLYITAQSQNPPMNYGVPPPGPGMGASVPPPYNPHAMPSAPPPSASPYPSNPSPYPPGPSPYAAPPPPSAPGSYANPYSAPQYPPQYPPQQQYPPPNAYPSQYPPGPSMYAPPPPAAPGSYGAPYGYPSAYPAPSPYPPAPTAYPSYGYSQPQPRYFQVPTTYIRTTYTYPSSYNPYSQFVLPVGLPPHLHQKMYQASAAFRYFDRDHSGYLSKKEWKHAMRHMGLAFYKGDAKRLFYLVDTDRSGRISEREFCEFWLQYGL